MKIKTEIGTTILVVISIIFVVVLLLEGKDFSNDINTISASVGKNVKALEEPIK